MIVPGAFPWGSIFFLGDEIWRAIFLKYYNKKNKSKHLCFGGISSLLKPQTGSAVSFWETADLICSPTLYVTTTQNTSCDLLSGVADWLCSPPKMKLHIGSATWIKVKFLQNGGGFFYFLLWYIKFFQYEGFCKFAELSCS